MLEVGHPNLTFDQSKTHFSLWVLAKAPLLLSLDLKTVSTDMLELIRNPTLLDFHQDPNTIQAQCFVGCSIDSDVSVLATKWGNFMLVLVVHWLGDEASGATSASMKQNAARSLPRFVNTTWSIPSIGIVPTPDETVTVHDIFTGRRRSFDYHSSQHVPIQLGPCASAVYLVDRAPAEVATSVLNLS